VGPKYDVGIYAPYAGVLYGDDPDVGTGGAETQMRELARSLAGRGLNVSHIVFDYPGIREQDGVHLVQQPLAEYTRKWPTYGPTIWSALERADARVYIQRCAGYEAFFVALFAKVRRRRFVYSSSSTGDFVGMPDIPTWSPRLAYRMGIRLADACVVQTAEQVALAEAEFGLDATLIPSFCEPAHNEGNGSREAFLWIGGLIDYKDPMAYLDLAEQVPEASFWMVVHARGDRWRRLEERVRARAAELANVELFDHRSRPRLLPLYERAVAVVNTSRHEGYPNTFMEGWARGTPVLSLNVDPDGVVGTHGLGAVAGGSIKRMAELARQLWAKRDDLQVEAQATRRYVAEAHAPAVVVEQWAELIERVAAR
jgi:glycosyltransferase involved in cell wall biosynthesis